MNSITKKQAQEMGQAWFFTGKQCRNGHIDKRSVISGTCYECNRKSSNKRHKELMKDKDYRNLRHYKMLKNRALLNDIDFNLDLEDIVPPDVCPVLGIPLDCSTHWNKPSVDRINPKLGYVKGNVVVISMRANTLKWNCVDPSELRKVADYIEKVCV